MLEVEWKSRVSSLDRLNQALAAVGAAPRGAVEQVDQYFAHPSRDFAATDEALRIRRVGERNFVTYKGPKVDTETKARREIELPLIGGEAAAGQFGELLAALGFQPVTTVRKRRTLYELTWQARPVEIAVDDVDELGPFVEIETAADEKELETARRTITSLAEKLGLAASERRSYLELLLERRGAGRVASS